MKVFARLSDKEGNETEYEPDELSILVNSEEVQQLIDFLTYVKEDHLVQHRDNGIPVTHNLFLCGRVSPLAKPICKFGQSRMNGCIERSVVVIKRRHLIFRLKEKEKEK